MGLPAFWPTNQEVPLFTSSIGLLIILLYFPGGFTQIGYAARGVILNWLEKRLPPAAVKPVTAPPPSLRRVATAAVTLNDDNSILRTKDLTVRFGGIVAVDNADFRAMPGEVIGLIGRHSPGENQMGAHCWHIAMQQGA